MKSLLMVLSTVISITIGFVLANTLYEEERRIVKEGKFYFVIDADKSMEVVMSNKWDNPSRMVF